jgi:hypothetical protein
MKPQLIDAKSLGMRAHTDAPPPRDAAHLVTVSSPDLHLNAWAASTPEAEALAEALYEARPQWRIAIDGNEIVFSRDGKVVDLIARSGHAPRATESRLT